MTAAVEPGGFVNRMPRYEILSEEAMETIERGWRRLMSEVGVRFDPRRAARSSARPGQSVDDDGVVRLDPDFALEQIALAPASFELRARNPERSVTIGGDHMVFTNVAGPPFVYEDGVRRDAPMGDFERFISSPTSCEIDSQGGLPCEPSDLLSTRATSTCRSRRSALGQAAHGRALRGLEVPRRSRAGGDRVRRPR